MRSDGTRGNEPNLDGPVLPSRSHLRPVRAGGKGHHRRRIPVDGTVPRYAQFLHRLIRSCQRGEKETMEPQKRPKNALFFIDGMKTPKSVVELFDRDRTGSRTAHRRGFREREREREIRRGRKTNC
ncbi:hypothetical protein BHM03_00023452 [Ensete ventricosum]|nr:hypothetical protein BHM03_00023452 [Ensete ventricosum]